MDEGSGYCGSGGGIESVSDAAKIANIEIQVSDSELECRIRQNQAIDLTPWELKSETGLEDGFVSFEFSLQAAMCKSINFLVCMQTNDLLDNLKLYLVSALDF